MVALAGTTRLLVRRLVLDIAAADCLGWFKDIHTKDVFGTRGVPIRF